MNKKGFTLTELLAVIVLLGLLLSIGIASVTSISSSVKKRQRENVIKTLKVDAEKYHHDTGIPKVFVDTLIKEGYTDADKTVTMNSKPVKIVVDPYPDNQEEINANFNCYYFDFEQSNENNQFIKTDMNNNNECNLDIVSSALIDIKYCASDTASCSSYSNVSSSTWINKEYVYLTVQSNDNSVLNINGLLDGQIQWISPSNPGDKYSGKVFPVTLPESRAVTDTFQVIVSANNRTYRNSKTIKIDKNPPKIDKITIDKENKWTQSKKITIEVSDKESGLAKYKVSLDNAVPTGGWTNFPGTASSSNPQIKSTRSSDLKTGTIDMVVSDTNARYIWVMDNAGNISLASGDNNKVQAPKTDTTKPTCPVYNENSTWTNIPVTISYGCSDGESGCHSTNQTVTYNNNKTVTHSWTIYDKAGNKTECKRDSSNPIKVYVDTTNPTCHWTGENTTWKNTTVTVKVEGKDNEGLSGINTSYKTQSWTYSTGTTKTANLSFEIRDIAGNKVTCSRNANVYFDKIKPTCHWSGENTTWKNTQVTIKVEGKDETGGSGMNASYTSKSWPYTSGTVKTRSLSYEIRDKAGNKETCSRNANVYFDKTNPTCHWSGENTTWKNTQVTIKVEGKDDTGGSGMHSSYKTKSWPYTSGTTKTKSLSFEIRDIAGNKVTCSRNANIYFDKTNPTCSWTGGNWTTWTKNTRSVTVTGSDETGGSGINNSYKTNTWTYSSGTTKTASLSYEIRDKAGNRYTCTKSAGIYVDKNAPSCSWSGGGSNWKTGSRSVSVSATDSGSGVKSGYTGTSWTESSGTIKTKYYSYYTEDKVGNSKTCGETMNIYIDNNRPTCSVNKTTTGSIYGVSGNVTCSDPGGSGCTTGTQYFSNKYSGATYYVYDAVGWSGSCQLSVSSYNVYKYNDCSTCSRCSDASCEERYSCQSSYYCGSYCSKYEQYTENTCGSSGYDYINGPNGPACCSEWTAYSCQNPTCTCKTRARSCYWCGCSSWGGWSGYVRGTHGTSGNSRQYCCDETRYE